MEEEEIEESADDDWEYLEDRPGNSQGKKPEPEIEDIEDQLARNEAYIFQLSAAEHRLRGISLYWYVAASILLMIGVFMAVPTVMVTGSLAYLVPQGIVGQTVWNTFIALLLVAAIVCFIRFVTLRHLAREASEVAHFNRHVLQSVRDRLERAA